MKRLFSYLLLMIGAYTAGATTYYLSKNGNDEFDGKSKTTAWCSLEKLNTSINLMHPGDSILLERGSSFRGQLTILQSALYVGSYSQGANPVINGSIEVRKWSLIKSNIWMSECSECPDNVGNLFIDGNVQPLGRYPDTGYLPFTEASHSESTVTDTLVSFKDHYWDNAELVVKSSRWTLDKLPVSVYQNKTFHTSSLPSYPLVKGFGYFIQQHLSTLTYPGEWFYDTATKCLYLYMDKPLHPAIHYIEVSVLPFGLQATNVDDILVENITFQHQKNAGVQISNGSAVRLNRLEILHSANNGMEIKGTRNACVENCSIRNAGNNGVEWTGNVKGVFRKNTLSNIGMHPGRGESGNGTYIGLRMYSNDQDGENLVEQNTLDSIGYSGLDFRTGHTTIFNNSISNFCLVKDDGGGIYTWNNTWNGNSLSSNTIRKGAGCGEGTSQPTKRYAYGIYIDDRSSELDLLNNSIFNCATAGVFIHNSKRINITGNTAVSNGTSVANSERGQLYIRLDTLGKLRGKVDLNLRVSKNTWVADRELTYGMYLSAPKKRDIEQLGNFTQNQFKGVNSQHAVAELFPEHNSCSAPFVYSLADWQSGSSYEKESISIVLPDKTGNHKRTKNLITNGSMTTNLKGWSVWPEKSIMLHLKSNADNNASLNAIRPQENKEVLLYHGGITLVKGKLYRLSFSARSAEKTSVEFVPLMEKSPWRALSDYTCFSLDSDMKPFIYYFRPTENQTQARVNFKSNSTFWIENVMLYEMIEPQ